MASLHYERVNIEWSRLLREFQDYQPDAAISALDSAVFVESLVEPALGFVASFLRLKGAVGKLHDDGVKALYAYLLQKRYDERLNLLYFAFAVFDEDTRLPREIIEQTPLPHEDGVPSFGCFGQPGFSLELVMD
jgi:hypothetical protein